MSLDQRSTVQSPNRCAAWHRPGGATDIDRGFGSMVEPTVVRSRDARDPLVASADRGHRRRLPDRHRHVRDADELRAVHRAAVGAARLGPRGVRARDRGAEPAVGRRPAVRGRDRRPLRRRACARGGRGGVRARHRADGRQQQPGDARADRRRAGRARPLRRLVHDRDRRLCASGPRGAALISAYGAAAALVLLAGSVALVPILAGSLSGRGAAEPDAVETGESTTAALRQALAHPSYVLLTSGFFVCGFHIAFISTHLPPYLTDLGISTSLAAWALGLIGLFNVIGAYSAGVLGGTYPKRLLLSGIYLGRGITFALFLLLPASPLTVLVFAASIGLLWLSTVPLTSGLVALMFGTRHVGMLFGLVFLSHQVGAFIGVWLGGIVYEGTGAYEAMWVLCIALSVF